MDCENCPDKENCDVPEFAKWDVEHDEELKQMIRKEATCIFAAETIRMFTGDFPLLALNMKTVCNLVESAMRYGYWKGRCFSVIPKVFEEV